MILLVHRLLLLVLVGFYTLPKALLARAHTSVRLADTAAELRTGVLTTETVVLPCARIAAVNVTRSMCERLFGAGTLTIASGNNTIKIAELEHAEQARGQLQAAMDVARTR